MWRLPCLWFQALRNVGAFDSHVDRDRGDRAFSTLTCHFLIPALDVCPLASGVIELGGTALLVLAVCLAALLQPRLMTMIVAAVALAVIAPAA
jgi:hypothetical protein